MDWPDAATTAADDRPFTVAWAERHGHSRRVLQARRFQTALLAAPPDCAASHHSGLLLYDIDVGDDLTPHLSTLDAEPTRIRGVTTHRLSMMSTRTHDGWRVLT